MARIIGITHRIKQTADKQARPTLVCVLAENKKTFYRLETETDELDFLLGRFPISYRPVADDEDLSQFHYWQIQFRPLNKKKNELPEQFPANLLKRVGKEWQLAEKVPAEFDGLEADDLVAMIMGGSGDRFGYAIARRGEEIDAKLVRIKPATLKEKRGNKSDEDRLLLAKLAISEPELFEEITPRDAKLISLREAYFQRQDAMKDRIACEQRLQQRFVGQIFLTNGGLYPEGCIEDMADTEKASDKILLALIDEEGRRERELKKLIEDFDVYKEIFKNIEGVGPMIAARLIVAVGDIRRFSTEAKFKKFCGVHVMSDGTFARRRVGEAASWQPEARQAMYLLGDQFNRRPDSVWGLILRDYKAKLRKTHPEVVCKNCGKVWSDGCAKDKHTRMYTDGHIHKMALWRTVTKFAEALYRDWTAIYAADSEIEPTA